jgi:hypothetical protein
MQEYATQGTASRERSSISHNFGLTPPRDGNYAALASAAASWNDAQSRSIRAAGARIAKLEDARRRFRDAMGREIGADTSRRFREFSQHQREAFRALLRAGDSANRLQVARNARDQSLRLMTESGVSREKLRALYGNFKGELAQIVRPERAASSPLTKVSLQDVPKPIRDGVLSGDFKMSTTTSDGLTIFTPPYDAWWWKGSWWRSGGDDPSIDIYPDSSTGSIGHRSEWYDGDASDDDAFTLDYDTSVSVWYNPPKSGVLDVHILATCSSSRYDIYLEDEWGWSDSDSYMQSYLTANVSPVIDDEDKTDNWDAHIGGSPDGDSYIDEPFPPGNVQMFHLTTSQALAGGVWSMLRVGTYEHRFTFLNDVSTRQLMRNRWFVNAIFVRVQ